MRNQSQKGFTVLGLVVTVVLVVLVIILIAKIFPVFAEYRTISRVALHAAQGTSEAEVRRRYDDQIRVEGVSNRLLTGKDLRVEIVGNSTTVSFVYEREVSIIGDTVFLLFKLNGEQRRGTAF